MDILVTIVCFILICTTSTKGTPTIDLGTGNTVVPDDGRVITGTTTSCFSSIPTFTWELVSEDGRSSLSQLQGGPISAVSGGSCGSGSNLYAGSASVSYGQVKPTVFGQTVKIRLTINNNPGISTTSTGTLSFTVHYNLTGSPQAAALGQEFTWTCHRKSNPNDTFPGVKFFRNEIEVGILLAVSSECKIEIRDTRYNFNCISETEYTLTIPSQYMTEYEQNSVWRCGYFSGQSAYSSVQKRLTIAIDVSSVNLEPPDNPLTLTEGSQREVWCTVNSNAFPTPTYAWFIDTTDITSTAGSNLSSVIITGSKTDNGKVLRCQATNNNRPKNGSTVLNITYKPTINITPPSPYQIREGDTAVIHCVVTDANPNTGITWRWTKTGDPAVLYRGQNYTIPNIHRGERGTYQCTATNSIGASVPATVQVDVQYQPSIEEKPRVIVNESQSVTLTRRVFSNPLSNVYWYSGRELLHTQMSVETAELILRHALCTDTKNFTIVASNGIQNNATSVVELLVNCKPYPGSNNITLGITDTSGIEFSTTITAYPQPQYKLKYENGTENRKMTDILSQNAVNNFTLRFNQTTVHQSDYGVYHLEVRNSFGMSTTFVNVIPQRKPNSPTEIEVTCEENQVKVQWKSSFNGGANQSFTAFALNGEQEAGRSVLVTDTGMDNIHTVFVRNLQPSTSYVFYVSAKNIHGEKSSTTASCTTLKAPAEDTSNVEAIAGGAAAGGIGLAVIVIVIVIFVRRYSEHGKQTSKNHRLTDNGEENESQDGDGLKVNALYVSADIVNDEKPGPSETAVYAEVNKRGPESDSNANVYAEVKETGKKAGEDKVTNGAVKPKKGVFKKEEKPKQKKGKKQKLAQEMPDVYENSEDIAMKQRGDDVYSNTGENRPPKQEQRGYKNQDGLLYVEVQFEAKADTGKSVIYGEEEKTDYATVEFPFPPSSQKTAQGEKKEK